MKAERKSENRPVVGALRGVRQDNYHELARQFVASTGRGFVIRGIAGEKGAALTREPATEPQWAAWLGYWERLGMSGRFMAFLRDHGVAAVPAEWPELFDAEAEPSEHEARLPGRRAEAPWARQAVIAGYARLRSQVERAVAHMDVSDVCSGRARPKREARTLDELAAEYRATPAELSEGARRLMGCGQVAESDT